MKDNFRFMRDIWLFNEEDKGFSYEGLPGGYLRIEVRQGKGKIYAMIQNLKEAKPGQSYVLYLLRIKERDSNSIKIGSIIVSKGRGELTWEFDPINVGDSNFIISDFNACALVLENGQSKNSTDIQCPLIAYKKEKVRWRDGFANAAMDMAASLARKPIEDRQKPIKDRQNNVSDDDDNEKRAAAEEPEIENTPAEDAEPLLNEKPPIDELYSKYTGKTETRYSLYSEDSVPDIADVGMILPDNMVGNVTKDIDREIDKETDEEIDGEIDGEIDKDIDKKEKAEENRSHSKDEFSNYIYDEQYIREVLYQNMDNEAQSYDERNKVSSDGESRADDDKFIANKEFTDDEEPIEDKESVDDKEFIIDRESVDNEKSEDEENQTDDKGSRESIIPEIENEINNEINIEINTEQQDDDKISTYDKQKRAPDMIKLIRLLDREFKRCDPFNSRRRDYRWWSINSPVNLVNVLEECRINVPSFFSPSVVMAYFKYRYLIAGIYISRRRGKEFFVCGIPGTYNIDESPFGDMCRWVQVERKSREYGAFGYWVTYVDPNTGELLRFN